MHAQNTPLKSKKYDRRLAIIDLSLPVNS